MYYWSVSPRTYLYSATVADRCLVDENLLFIRRWAAAAKIKMIMAAVAAELYQEIRIEPTLLCLVK